MKNKILVVVIGIVVLAGIIFLISPRFNPSNGPTVTQAPVEKITISQKILLSKDAQDDFSTIEIDTGKTALDLLQQTTTIETKGEGKNAYVTEINGVATDTDKKEFWAFYVNGKQAEVGAGSYVLKAGDKIEWKIDTY